MCCASFRQWLTRGFFVGAFSKQRKRLHKTCHTGWTTSSARRANLLPYVEQRPDSGADCGIDQPFHPNPNSADRIGQGPFTIPKTGRLHSPESPGLTPQARQLQLPKMDKPKSSGIGYPMKRIAKLGCFAVQLRGHLLGPPVTGSVSLATGEKCVGAKLSIFLGSYTRVSKRAAWSWKIPWTVRSERPILCAI